MCTLRMSHISAADKDAEEEELQDWSDDEPMDMEPAEDVPVSGGDVWHC